MNCVHCIRCGSEELLNVNGETTRIWLNGNICKMPDNELNLGGYDYLQFVICLTCGQVQGDWPVDMPDVGYGEKDVTRLIMFCKRNKDKIMDEFSPRLTEEQWAHTQELGNWVYDQIEGEGGSYTCIPEIFDDSLRGYIYRNAEGKVTQVLVQGE